MLADLKMPGALEAVDGILAQADSGATIAGEPIEQLLGAQIMLRNNRRLETAMRSSHLPLVKTLAQFDFSWNRPWHLSSWASSPTPVDFECPGHRCRSPHRSGPRRGVLAPNGHTRSTCSTLLTTMTL